MKKGDFVVLQSDNYNYAKKGLIAEVLKVGEFTSMIGIRQYGEVLYSVLVENQDITPAKDNESCQCEECITLFKATGEKHLSSCAVHNEPAYPKGECNCREADENV